ncbi:rh50 isoform b [Anaeramoeba flamelloides]|uniref:Rh50 isoform b n=1 Tax=Anaeramoeba flamelloides TaxID=1746091 RepID=A0AAV7ZNW6_9EUKA|nr:rh50 isoform b [Anaeramoeba flamelloides]
MGFTKSNIGFITTLVVLQIAIFVVIGIWFRYDESLDETEENEYDQRAEYYYTYYSDVAVMVIIGFGYLMTFLKKYGLSSLGYTFLLAGFCVQWTLINNAFWHQIHEHEDLYEYKMTIPSLVEGMFGAATVMISFGAVLGKTTPLQLLLIAFFEIIFYAFNIFLSVFKIGLIDIGGSLIIHTFGAYFGIALTAVLTSRRTEEHQANHKLGATKISDVFSLIGTIFLWLFWPSFNGALGVPGSRFRVVINTVMSLCCSCVVTFFFSAIFHKGKFDPVDIQNATLAGGVAVGSAANLYLTPGGAMGVGLFAGMISTIGFNYLTPLLENRTKLHDTCGVHNLHGMPGLIGGAVSAIVTAIGSHDHSLYNGAFDSIFVKGDDQPLHQLSAMFVTLTIALSGGLITGFIIRLLTKNAEDPFEDEEFWGDEDEDSEADLLSDVDLENIGNEKLMSGESSDSSNDRKTVSSSD